MTDLPPLIIDGLVFGDSLPDENQRFPCSDCGAMKRLGSMCMWCFYAEERKREARHAAE